MAILGADALRPVRAQGRIRRRGPLAPAAGVVRAVALRHPEARTAFHQVADGLLALELVFPDRRACKEKEDAECEDWASGRGPVPGRQQLHEGGKRKDGASLQGPANQSTNPEMPLRNRGSHWDVCTILHVRVPSGARPTGQEPALAFTPRGAPRSESEAPRWSPRQAGSRATRCLLARARPASRTRVPARCPSPWW